MTARELYAADPGFREFMAHWVRDRRCPFPLGDYLEDRELYGPADCARWMHEGGDWGTFKTGSISIDRINRLGPCGRFPLTFNGETWKFRFSNEAAVPSGRHWGTYARSGIDRDVEAGTVEECLLAVMDLWVP